MFALALLDAQAFARQFAVLGEYPFKPCFGALPRAHLETRVSAHTASLSWKRAASTNDSTVMPITAAISSHGHSGVRAAGCEGNCDSRMMRLPSSVDSPSLAIIGKNSRCIRESLSGPTRRKSVCFAAPAAQKDAAV